MVNFAAETVNFETFRATMHPYGYDRGAMTIFPRLFLLTAILAGGYVPHVMSAERSTLIKGLNVSALQSGSEATLAIGIQIAEGFHAQSHTPSQPNYIPFQVVIDHQPRITFGEPIYPAGEDHTYPALGKLNVYTGKVIVYVPVTVSADAPTGPAKITGQLTYQICDDKTCFFPERPKFEITTTIVSATEPVQTINADLFEGYAASAIAPVAPTNNPPASVTPSASGTIAKEDWSIWTALGVAFFAGLLFNVMPCVLPVLPLKAAAFSRAAEHHRSRSMMLGAAFSVGIVAVFAILAILVLVLRVISWGSLFSNPWFVWSIVVLLVICAFGLFGAFTFRLPTMLYNVDPSQDTIGGNVVFGAFTAILATPCTAPLLPPLLLWASVQPGLVGVLAMLFVGVGMAFPYFLLSAMPEVARKFPRTGPWSELFKQMMGFLLLASAMYFAGGRLVHGAQFWWLVTGVIAVAAFFLVGRTAQLTKNSGPVAVSALIAVLMFGGSLYWTARINGLLNPTRGGVSPAASTWTPYSNQAFADARDNGNIVLVKFTANWCASCQYIEGTVFQNATVWNALHDRHVVTLKVDLTEESAPGKDLLLQLNPAGGIPLTAIFAPGKDPVVLASVYDSDELLATLNQIAPPAQSVMAR
jgi:thiol:disulfide interchange protein DsbD